MLKNTHILLENVGLLYKFFQQLKPFASLDVEISFLYSYSLVLFLSNKIYTYGEAHKIIVWVNEFLTK
jgi:hypothetical protein